MLTGAELDTDGELVKVKDDHQDNDDKNDSKNKSSAFSCCFSCFGKGGVK